MNLINLTSDILFYKFIVLTLVAGFVIIMVKMVDFDLIKEDFKIMTESVHMLKLYSSNEKFLSSKGIDLNKIRFSSHLVFLYNSEMDQIFPELNINLDDPDDKLTTCSMVNLKNPDYYELKEHVNSSEKGFVFFLSENLIDEVYYFDLDLIK